MANSGPEAWRGQRTESVWTVFSCLCFPLASASPMECDFIIIRAGGWPFRLLDTQETHTREYMEAVGERGASTCPHCPLTVLMAKRLAVLHITDQAAADRHCSAAVPPGSPHRTHICGKAESWGHRTEHIKAWSLTTSAGGFVHFLSSHINSVSLICQGRKPSVLSTEPNFTTSSGSGIFLDSGKKHRQHVDS